MRNGLNKPIDTNKLETDALDEIEGVSDITEEAPPDPVKEIFTYDDIDSSRLRKAVDYWKRGMVDREVSEKLGIPVVYVSSMRKFLGLKANCKHVSTRTRRAAVSAMRKEGMEASEIAKMLKVRVSLVATWIEADSDD